MRITLALLASLSVSTAFAHGGDHADSSENFFHFKKKHGTQTTQRTLLTPSNFFSTFFDCNQASSRRRDDKHSCNQKPQPANGQ